jgi:hypothetical protein
MAIDLGDLIRLEFTNTAPGSGALVNPDTVTVTVTLPDGTALAPQTVAPASTGKFQYDYLTTVAGRHTVRWLGIGTNPGAYTDAFDVRPAGSGYILSLQDAKTQLNITGTTRDEELRRYLEAVTGTVEKFLGQKIVRSTITEEHHASGRIALNWSPVISLTSMARVDGTYTWDVNTLHVSPAGVVSSPLGVAPYGDVRTTYVAGMSIVPEDYALASLIILQHVWQTKRGDKGAPRTGGMADTANIGTGHIGYFIPNAAMELLGGGIPGIA